MPGMVFSISCDKENDNYNFGGCRYGHIQISSFKWQSERYLPWLLAAGPWQLNKGNISYHTRTKISRANREKHRELFSALRHFHGEVTVRHTFRGTTRGRFLGNIIPQNNRRSLVENGPFVHIFHWVFHSLPRFPPGKSVEKSGACEKICRFSTEWENPVVLTRRGFPGCAGVSIMQGGFPAPCQPRRRLILNSHKKIEKCSVWELRQTRRRTQMGWRPSRTTTQYGTIPAGTD